MRELWWDADCTDMADEICTLLRAGVSREIRGAQNRFRPISATDNGTFVPGVLDGNRLMGDRQGHTPLGVSCPRPRAPTPGNVTDQGNAPAGPGGGALSQRYPGARFGADSGANPLTAIGGPCCRDAQACSTARLLASHRSRLHRVSPRPEPATKAPAGSHPCVRRSRGHVVVR